MVDEKLDKIEIDADQIRRRHYRSNWPLLGGTITYRHRGRVLPDLNIIRERLLIERKAGLTPRQIRVWIQGIRINSIQDGEFDYEMTVVSTSEFEPVPE